MGRQSGPGTVAKCYRIQERRKIAIASRRDKARTRPTAPRRVNFRRREGKWVQEAAQPKLNVPTPVFLTHGPVPKLDPRSRSSRWHELLRRRTNSSLRESTAESGDSIENRVIRALREREEDPANRAARPIWLRPPSGSNASRGRPVAAHSEPQRAATRRPAAIAWASFSGAACWPEASRYLWPDVAAAGVTLIRSGIQVPTLIFAATPSKVWVWL